ncbi:MAG TPA: metallopeptidase TldD-related protein [Candidatus Dormibacteraeota bacterium]|nr:metallopeptidase TldD-related protein [Candidatus Dormibacteraeota bacterium]
MVTGRVSRRAAPDEVLDLALARVVGGEAEALYVARDAALTRFAGSRIHQNVAEHDATVRVRIVDGGRSGVASTNRLDEEGVREVVARATEICRRAAPNPDPAPLPPAGAGGVESDLGFVPATANAEPERRAEGARAVIAAADAARLEASGAFSTEATTIAIANTNGLRSSHTTTQAKLLTVVTGEDRASGYAQASSTDVSAIDAAAVGAEAADKAAMAAGAADLEPGEYDVILEEYAVANVIEYLSFAGFSALAVEEGRSFMELGQQVMGPSVSIWDDGADPAGLPAAIDFEGVAKQRVDLVTDGVARAVVHDSATARRAGTTSTGHGLPAPNTFGPIAWNLFMAPGSSSKASMLSSIERGLWVTRFHYVNIVHPRKAVLTGMTKDGTFLIEGGRIVGPVRNLRFTQAIPEAFGRIEAISAETRLVAAEYSGISARVPALRIGRFAFTGATAAESA